MNSRDRRQITRRLQEVVYIMERGYEPAYAFGEPLWIKCHWGSIHTHEGALREIERDEREIAA